MCASGIVDIGHCRRHLRQDNVIGDPHVLHYVRADGAD